MTGFPFPFLRHGASPTKALDAFVAFADPSTKASSFVARFRKLPGTPSVRVERGVLALEAGALTLAAFEQELLAVHAGAPVGLVVRTNGPKLKVSAWHRASVLEVSAVLDVLERHVKGWKGAYAGRLVQDEIGSDEDVGALLVRSLEGRAPLAELVAVTLETLEASCRGHARHVLVDQLQERLPSLFGTSFAVDLVARRHLAWAQEVSPNSIEMPQRFLDAWAATMRRSHGRYSVDLAGPGKVSWSKLADVKRAIAAGDLKALVGLREQDTTHTKTLLALEPGELKKLATNRTLALRMANAAALCLPGRYVEALKLYDAALDGQLPALACANPLYAVQDDNNHLGVDEARARHYLARCLPHGNENPTIFLNASFVLMELGEHEQVFDVLKKAKAGGVAIKHHRNERLFAPIRNDPRFQKLMK